uniref:Uncharacterized protein n=1 Tax=Opuntia streptacantha TaxID=393608 RepID=A0A7C8YV89_OPUST
MSLSFGLTNSMYICHVPFNFPNWRRCCRTLFRVSCDLVYVSLCNYRTSSDCHCNIVGLLSLDCCGVPKNHVHWTAFRGYETSVAFDSWAYCVQRQPQLNVVILKAIVITEACCWIGLDR